MAGSDAESAHLAHHSQALVGRETPIIDFVRAVGFFEAVELANRDSPHRFIIVPIEAR